MVKKRDTNNMKFLVDENIQSEKRAVNYVDVGIHENMELTEIKVSTSPKGNNFLAFTFTDPDGRVLTKTEWQPTSILQLISPFISIPCNLIS